MSTIFFGQLVAEHLLNKDFSATDFWGILEAVSTVKEIEAAIPKLSRAEIEEIREWIDDYLEDRMELSNETKASLEQSHREISSGQVTTRQPK